jgi:hypothetical protein
VNGRIIQPSHRNEEDLILLHASGKLGTPPLGTALGQCPEAGRAFLIALFCFPIIHKKRISPAMLGSPPICPQSAADLSHTPMGKTIEPTPTDAGAPFPVMLGL